MAKLAARRVETRLVEWLASYWVIGAGFMAAALLALAPVLAATLPLTVFLIFLHSPLYMLHQVEEHAGDRFRRFANERMFGGREGLSVPAVLVINLPLVWGLNLAALYAVAFCGPGWGLVAPYALVVNALNHLAAGLKLHAYNPGLVTALVLFLPLGFVTITLIAREPSVGLADHLVGLGGALLLHALIIAHVSARLRRMARPAA